MFGYKTVASSENMLLLHRIRLLGPLSKRLECFIT